MNMDVWEKVKRPPQEVLKTIKGGRLKGMTDISPQWRYQVMTEVFGMCGIGWKYEIVRLWNEVGSAEQVMAFAEILLYVKHEGAWSDPIPGIGGAALVTKESGGLYSSDEGFKMAVTDALSVAMKMLGVAADIYMGAWDGSKYMDSKEEGKSLPEKKILEMQKQITDQTTIDGAKETWGKILDVCKEIGDHPAAERLKKITIDHCAFIKKAQDNESEDIKQ